MCLYKLLKSESEAVSEYQEAIDTLNPQDTRIRKVLEEIRDDELKHIGSLMKALEWQNPSAVQAIAEGISEAEEI